MISDSSGIKNDFTIDPIKNLDTYSFDIDMWIYTSSPKKSSFNNNDFSNSNYVLYDKNGFETNTPAIIQKFSIGSYYYKNLYGSISSEFMYNKQKYNLSWKIPESSPINFYSLKHINHFVSLDSLITSNVKIINGIPFFFGAAFTKEEKLIFFIGVNSSGTFTDFTFITLINSFNLDLKIQL